METTIKKEVEDLPADEELDDEMFAQMNPDDGFKL